MSDRITVIITSLFILSMISERIVTYIKLWCVKGRVFLFFVVPEDVNTCKKSDDPEVEAKRSRSILAINITMGCAIALICKASLFDMFTFNDNVNSFETLFSWEHETFGSNGWEVFKRIVSIVVGCILTGFFISLGSKFWHDLLDLLLQAKNLKAKLVDKASYEGNAAAQIEEYVNTDYYELARIALDKNKNSLDAMEGVENYFVGPSSDPLTQRPVVILNSSLGSGGGYPSALRATLPSGKEFSVPVEVVYGHNIPEIQLGSGDNVCHTDTAHVEGTICCSVTKSNRNYLLTCAHVLTGGLSTINANNKNGWFTQPVENDTCSEDESYQPIGTWNYGQIKSSLDVALIETEYHIAPITLGMPKAYKPELILQEVFVNGNKNKRSGYIRGFLEKETDFKYNGSTLKHTSLILISKDKSDNPKTLTQGGDSGAMVYFKSDKAPLGMVLGGNSQYTYVMPLEDILSVTQTKLT